MSGMNGDRSWALRIAERVERGEAVAYYVVKQAAEVLGRPILRGGKHAARPDGKDRQAGDDHRYEEMVAL